MLEFVERKGSLSLKHDALKERFGREDLQPLWVADMDCRAPQVVRDAIGKYLEHGVYGYSSGERDMASRAAVLHWLQTQHGVTGLRPEDCRIYAGVLEALAVCIEVLCPISEGIILQSPAYNCFYHTLEDSGRPVLETYLEAGAGQRDFIFDTASLERQIKESGIKPRIFLLCSPHNPVGKVWSKTELQEVIEFCQKHDLYLISDEIHFDLVYPGKTHLNLLRQDLQGFSYDKIILISAPSKTFNIPSLRTAYLVCRNPEIMRETKRFCERFQIGDISLLGHLALQACYTEPAAKQWLQELLQYLGQNRNLLHDFLNEKLPLFEHQKPDATYLYWVNCQNFLQGSLNGKPEKLHKFFMDAGLALGWGTLYHGETWVRINFGCERSALELALEKWERACLFNDAKKDAVNL